jgi:ferredoxin
MAFASSHVGVMPWAYQAGCHLVHQAQQRMADPLRTGRGSSNPALHAGGADHPDRQIAIPLPTLAALQPASWSALFILMTPAPTPCLSACLPACLQVFVDEFTCIGCRNCTNVCPSTFAIEEEYGRARAMRQVRGRPLGPHVMHAASDQLASKHGGIMLRASQAPSLAASPGPDVQHIACTGF